MQTSHTHTHTHTHTHAHKAQLVLRSSPQMFIHRRVQFRWSAAQSSLAPSLPNPLPTVSSQNSSFLCHQHAAQQENSRQMLNSKSDVLFSSIPAKACAPDTPMALSAPLPILHTHIAHTSHNTHTHTRTHTQTPATSRNSSVVFCRNAFAMARAPSAPRKFTACGHVSHN
jgi:hypothetical protein